MIETRFRECYHTFWVLFHVFSVSRLVSVSTSHLARWPWLTVYRALQVASRDEKTSLSESNLILQQATINPEQAKNYLYVLELEMISARDPTVGFSWAMASRDEKISLSESNMARWDLSTMSNISVAWPNWLFQWSQKIYFFWWQKWS